VNALRSVPADWEEYVPTAHINKLIPTEPVAAKMLDGVEKTGIRGQLDAPSTLLGTLKLTSGSNHLVQDQEYSPSDANFPGLGNDIFQSIPIERAVVWPQTIAVGVIHFAGRLAACGTQKRFQTLSVRVVHL